MPAFPNYSSLAPQVSVEQKFENVPTVVAADLPACFVGPAYILQRYGKDDPVEFAFTGNAQVLPWQRNVSGVATDLNPAVHLVDSDNARLYARAVEAVLATFTAAGTPSLELYSAQEPNVLRITSGALKGTGLATALRGRDLAVGDVLYCQAVTGSTIFRRTVTGFRGTTSASSFGSNTARNNSNAGNAASNPETAVAEANEISAPSGWAIACDAPEDFDGLARGARYGTRYGERFTITVHTAGAPGVAKVNIASASGKYRATAVDTTDDTGNFLITDTDAGGELGGVTLKLTPPAPPNEDLEAGDVFVIDVFGAYDQLSTTQVVAGGAFIGDADTTYMIQVVSKNSGGTNFTGATVRVSDTAGIDVASDLVTITDNTAFDLGSLGLTLKFHGSDDMPAQAGLRVGDIFFVHAKAGVVSTTAFDKVVLDGPAVDVNEFDSGELFSVEIRAPYTGEIAADAAEDLVAWTAGTDGLAVDSGLKIFLDSRDSGYEWCTLAADAGYLVPSFRAVILPEASEGYLTLTADNLETYLGPVDVENPIAFAVQLALIGSQGKPVLAVRAAGSSTANYQAALNKLRNSREPYELVVMTEDLEVWQAARTHVITASASDRLIMRRLRVALNSPGRYAVLSARSDTTNFTATVTVHGDDNLLLTVIAGADECNLLSQGLATDGLALIGGVYYEIASVISDTEVLLVSGPDAPIDPAQAVQFWREDTVATLKTYLRDRAALVADRRVTINWTDRPLHIVDGSSVVADVIFGAAELAGIRSYLPPQVGLTRQALSAFSSIPNMQTRFDPDDIKEITSYGIQVLNQDYTNAPVEVFDQVTTETQLGYLEFQENSTVRMDLLTRMINSLITSAKIVGPKNTTEDTANIAREKLVPMLDAASKTTLGAEHGPLIDGFDPPTVGLSPLVQNQINARVRVGIATPVGRFMVELIGAARL